MNNKESKEGQINIACSVVSVRYWKDEWGIIVVFVDKINEGEPIVDKNNCIVLKGYMPEVSKDKQYIVTANYVNDEKYGGQYNISCLYSSVVFDENDKKGQKLFLQTIFTEKQVDSMYKTLEDPFKVLKEGNATELVKVKGCGIHHATTWITRFENNIYMANIFTELSAFDLTNNMIIKLIDKYRSPDVVVDKVKNNPYVLCTEVDGIGWKTADKIALAGGIGLFSIQRVSAFILHYLEQSGQNGCSWISSDELMGAILEEIGEEIEDRQITLAIQSISDKLWWSENKDRLGLKKYYIVEERIAEELIRLRNAPNTFEYDNWEDTVKHVEQKQGWLFNEEQLEGIKSALENNVIIIHGEAGTGKTSLTSAILEILRRYSYIQCALSGRASSRMSEVTGEESHTIHRLLGYPCNEEGAKNNFYFHDQNPLNADIIVLDEISMVDASLFYYLLRAVKTGAKIICLGDMGQLESIGAGNIAYDMIHSQEIPTVYLSQVHRQAEKSAIVTQARKIRAGEQVIEKDYAGTQLLGELQDLYLDCYSDANNTFYKVMQEFSKAMNEDNFNIMETQVIVPMKNKGASSTWNINNTIQELYNPSEKEKPEITITSNGKPIILREGDKVINTKNSYKTNPPIYNGSIGIIKKIDPLERSLVVDFIAIGEVYIPKMLISGIELGYAITVHKAQGSQFDNVILGIDFSSYSLLSRELLYTGITRAKRYCSLFAQNNAFRMAVVKEGVSKKQTHLQDCLYNETHPVLKF